MAPKYQQLPKNDTTLSRWKNVYNTYQTVLEELNATRTPAGESIKANMIQRRDILAIVEKRIGYLYNIAVIDRIINTMEAKAQTNADNF